MGGSDTATVARCERSDLPVTMCAHCRGLDRVEVPDPADIFGESAEPERRGGPGPWFDAMYPGTCSRCDEPFGRGDLIRATVGGGYECEECGAWAGQNC